MITKDQLKLGDIVTLRMCKQFIICNTSEGIRLLSNDSWMPFEYYTNTLLYSRNRTYDIIRVFRPYKHFIKATSENKYHLDTFYPFDQVSFRDITNGIQSSRFINISLYV